MYHVLIKGQYVNSLNIYKKNISIHKGVKSVTVLIIEQTIDTNCSVYQTFFCIFILNLYP